MVPGVHRNVGVHAGRHRHDTVVPRTGRRRNRPGVSGLGLAARIAHWAKPAVIDPLVDFFSRFGRFALVIILFIVFFRLSDYVLGILANPFYLDIGFSKAEIASVAKIYGIIVSLVGAGAGGWAIVRYGIARCLIAATVLIASTNLFFAMMVYIGAEIWMLTVTISADNFAMGFGELIFIAYLSSLVNQSFTATQYALMSSLMSILSASSLPGIPAMSRRPSAGWASSCMPRRSGCRQYCCRWSSRSTTIAWWAPMATRSASGCSRSWTIQAAANSRSATVTGRSWASSCARGAMYTPTRTTACTSAIR